MKRLRDRLKNASIKEIFKEHPNMVLESLAIRVKHIEPGEWKEMEWSRKLKWDLVKMWDAIQGAKRIVDARTPKWKRIIKRVLIIAEAAIRITAQFCCKGIVDKVYKILDAG